LSANKYQKELSDFLILNLGHHWKNTVVQTTVKDIASVKLNEQADISTTHFHEAYEAQYNSEFFKNALSSMRREIAHDPAAFDPKTMQEVKSEITDKNGRSNIVFTALGAN